MAERSWDVRIAPPAIYPLARVVELVAPSEPRTARRRTKRDRACPAPAYLPPLHDARAVRLCTRSPDPRPCDHHGKPRACPWRGWSVH